MKYIVRAIKYYIYLMLMLALLIAVLIVLKMVEADPATIFVGGYRSYWQIALLMLAFSLLYPRFGYSSQDVHLGGETSETEPLVRRVMEGRGYKLGSRDADGNMTFVKSSPLDRAMRMWEDAITFTRTATGYSIEGHNREMLNCRRAIYDAAERSL